MSITTISDDFGIFEFGDYVIENNVWNKGDLVNGVDYFQTIDFDSEDPTQNGITFRWDWPKGGGTVVAYPEIWLGHKPFWNSSPDGYASQVSALHTFNVDLDIDVSRRSEYGNIAFDIWLTNEAYGHTSSITTELMIWLDHDSAAPWGARVGSLVSGGQRAQIYLDDNMQRGDRIWDYIAVVFKKPNLEGAIDIKDIISALEKKGLISGDDYVNGYELGAEIKGGSGSFTINHLNTEFKSNIVSDAADDLLGSKLNDVFDGRGGNDVIRGRRGNDQIAGGLGNDQLWGGAGRDTFIIDASGEANFDTIMDFSPRKDKVVFSTTELVTNSFSGLAAIGTGVNASATADLLYYDKTSGSLYFDIDGDGHGDERIAIINGAPPSINWELLPI